MCVHSGTWYAQTMTGDDWSMPEYETGEHPCMCGALDAAFDWLDSNGYRVEIGPQEEFGIHLYTSERDDENESSRWYVWNMHGARSPWAEAMGEYESLEL